MSLPSGDRMNPHDAAKAAAMTAEIHDVVISASKALHGQPLDERDTRALRWAREVLKLAESSDVMITMPSAQQLSGIGDAVVALRRAARSADEDPAPGFSELGKSVDAVLGGTPVEGSEGAMSSLRDLFALLSRVLLQTEVMRHGEEPSKRPWELSRTSSSL
jgi:hypothetical protein